MLIDCAMYEFGKRVKNIVPSDFDVSIFNEQSKKFIWAAYVDPEPGEIEKLCTKLGVHELALEDVKHGSQLPKMEEYDDHVFIVIKQLISDNKSNLTDENMYIFAGLHYVVTVRKNHGQGFSMVRKRAERESKLLSLGPIYVVYSIIDKIVDRYFPAISRLEEEMDTLEKQIFSDEPNIDRSSIIKRFHKAKEKIHYNKLVIYPLTEFITKLFGGRVPELFEGMDNYFRDIHDHLLRLSSVLESLNEAANSGVHTSVALITIEESKVTKKLAAWAAIFGASTLMAGIWGMNFQNMPELKWQYGYPFALTSIFCVALFIRYRFKKSGWM